MKSSMYLWSSASLASRCYSDNENDLQSGNDLTAISKKKKAVVTYSFFFILLLCSCFITNAQEKEITIRGQVSDEYGPLAGVIVQIKETTEYVFTDYYGKFTIEVPSENTILVFSMLGMVSQEVTIYSNAYFNVFMRYEDRYPSQQNVNKHNFEMQATTL